ncbi:hypothetical protein [Scytonema sp. NUACC21]
MAKIRLLVAPSLEEINRLRDEIARLKELRNYLESVKPALAWLNPNSRGNFLGELAEQASEEVI